MFSVIFQNLKKSWHPQTMKNQERVWKAEQANAAEKRRLHELQQEIQSERNREELKRIGQGSGILATDDDKRLEWMYKGPDRINREDYLTGRQIDKHFEKQDQEEKQQEHNLIGVTVPKNHVEHECIPFSIRAFRGAQTVSESLERQFTIIRLLTICFAFQSDEQVDIQRKIMEDPLMMIKQREMDKRKKLLENPVKLKEIHRLLRSDNDLKASTSSKSHDKKKKSSKSKKSKKKKSHKYSSDNSDSDLDTLLAKTLMKVQGDLGDKGIEGEKLKLDKLYNERYKKLSSELDKMSKSNKKHKKSKSKKTKKKKEGSDSSSDSDSESEKEPPAKRQREKRGRDDSADRKFRSDARRREQVNERGRSRSRSRARKDVRRNQDRRSDSRSKHRPNRSRSRDAVQDRRGSRYENKKRAESKSPDKANEKRPEPYKREKSASRKHRSRSRSTSRKRSRSPLRSRYRNDSSKIQNERHYNRERRRSRQRSRSPRERRREFTNRRRSRSQSKSRNRSKSHEKSRRDSRVERKARSRSNERNTKVKRSTHDEELGSKRKDEPKEKEEPMTPPRQSKEKSVAKETTRPIRTAALPPNRSRSQSSSSSSTSSSESSDSDDDAPAQTSRNYGLVTADGKKIELKTRNEEPPIKKVASTVTQESTVSATVQRKKLTEEEKAERLRQMQENVKWHDDEKSKRMLQNLKETEREREEASKEFDRDYIHRELHKALNNQDSVEARIKSNLNNIQRMSNSMNSNFTKR